MRARVRKKIERRMLDIDEMLVFIAQHGYWSEMDLWQSDMMRLKRRWPKIYRRLFYGDALDPWLGTQFNEKVEKIPGSRDSSFMEKALSFIRKEV